MALLKEISFRGGVAKDNSELAARPRWTDSDRIRFRHGLPEKIGGWQKYISTGFDGICRGMLSWLAADSIPRLCLGTHKRLYVVEGDNYHTITPIRDSGTLATNPFAATINSTSITVTHTLHGVAVDDYVTFAGATIFAGVTIDGEYQVTQVTDANTYVISHSVSATATAVGGGAAVTYEYPLGVGLVDGGRGYGWGVGGYGSGTYGTAAATGIVFPPRVWSIWQWGQYIVACPINGDIYQWTLDTGVPAAVLANAPTSNKGIFVTDEKHLVALGAGGSPMKVEWCDQDDNTVWTPSDQNTAGGRTLVGGAEILFGIPARGSNLIFTDSSVWTMTFIGGLDVFGFRQVAAGASGIIGPHAAASAGGFVYWMGRSDFWVFDGAVREVPGSDEVRQYVFDNLSLDQAAKVFCFINSKFSEVWWVYPDGTENNRYVKYNWRERLWDLGRGKILT